MASPAYLLPFGLALLLVGFLTPDPAGEVMKLISIFLLTASIYFDVRDWTRRK